MHVEPSATNATVTGAIRKAARMTGTDFRYLVATAQIESDFNPKAKATTSSARGLFQFIEQTWLHTLKEQGPALGYGPYANAIARLRSGKYVVTDPRLHGAVMSLRSDPTANAVMAGAFTRSNAARLAGTLGRTPAEGELYIAHFLGSSGASRLIRLAQSRPTAPAAAAFPGAAQANRAIFYDRQGHARSAREVYRALVGRYQIARAGPAAPAAKAAPIKELPPRPPAAVTGSVGLAGPHAAIAATAVGAASAAAAGAETSARRRAIALDPVARADTYPVAARAASPVVAGKDELARRRAVAVDPVATADGRQRAARATSSAVASRETGPIFHGLFRTDGAGEPVAPLVSALWTTPAQAPLKPAAGQRAPAGPALDLFQESQPDARALFRGRG